MLPGLDLHCTDISCTTPPNSRLPVRVSISSISYITVDYLSVDDLSDLCTAVEKGMIWTRATVQTCLFIDTDILRYCCRSTCVLLRIQMNPVSIWPNDYFGAEPRAGSLLCVCGVEDTPNWVFVPWVLITERSGAPLVMTLNYCCRGKGLVSSVWGFM